jgi:hypothetical protein
MASVLTSVSAGVKDTVMGANMKGKDEGIPTFILDTKVQDSVTPVAARTSVYLSEIRRSVAQMSCRLSELHR